MGKKEKTDPVEHFVQALSNTIQAHLPQIGTLNAALVLRDVENMLTLGLFQQLEAVYSAEQGDVNDSEQESDGDAQ